MLLRLFAPFLPFVTEEIWSWAYASETGLRSIHRAPWPRVSELAGVAAPSCEASLEIARAALGAVHKQKTLAGKSLGAPVEHAVLACGRDACEPLRLLADDVAAAARIVDLRISGTAEGGCTPDETDAITVVRIDYSTGHTQRDGPC